MVIKLLNNVSGYFLVTIMFITVRMNIIFNINDVKEGIFVENHRSNVVNLHEEDLLMEKLNDPKVMYELSRLLDRVEQMNLLFDFFETFLQRGPSMADSVIRLIVELRENVGSLGYLDKINAQVESLRSIQQFTESEAFKELQKVMLDEETIRLAQDVSNAALAARKEMDAEVSRRVGVFGLLKELGSAEVQPAIQFLLTFSKQLSKELKDA